MSLTSRGARAAARSLRQQPAVRQSKRNASSSDHGHGHGYVHTETAYHVASGPAKESFGFGFYVTMALIPLGYGVYTLASTPGENRIGKLVKEWRTREHTDGGQAVIHATMMDQALKDRSLFKNSPRDTAGPDLRFPEGFNAGSPWNVSAGQGTADLSILMEHYAERGDEEEKERISRMQNNKVVTVYDEQHVSHTAEGQGKK